MKVWAVVRIGCIECGADNETPVDGVYMTEAGARNRVDRIWRDANMGPRLSRDGLSISESDWQIRTQEVEVAP